MTFTSLGFLLFFPAVCLVWFCLPARVKPAWLLAASYWFYACADWRGPFLLAFTTVWSYAAARALASPAEKLAAVMARPTVHRAEASSARNASVIFW